jgi:enamine deaminase RidA (YjgF/YER057c/UK114 family)
MSLMPAVADDAPQIGRARPFAYAQDLLFVSAQSAGAGSRLTLAEQTNSTLKKLGDILTQAGASAKDIVKVGVFYHQSVLDQEREILAQVREAFQTEPPPIMTAIPLNNLPEGNLIQIELIGLKPAGRRSKARQAVTPNPIDGFSKAVRCDDVVFVGAQMARDATGKTLHEKDIVAQAKATIANIKSALNDVGADLPSVAKLNTYYVGFGTVEDWTMAARVRSDAFTKPGPGATGVPVPGPYPAGLLLRQEAIAIVNADGSPAHRDTSWPEGNWDWPIPVSFEQGLKINDLLITGGQVSASTTGEAVFPGDLAAQTKRTTETIAAILDGFGARCDELAKVTVFYATNGDRADIATVLTAIDPFFKNGLPALTMVPLDTLALRGIEIEIEGVGSTGLSS